MLALIMPNGRVVCSGLRGQVLDAGREALIQLQDIALSGEPAEHQLDAAECKHSPNDDASEREVRGYCCRGFWKALTMSQVSSITALCSYRYSAGMFVQVPGDPAVVQIQPMADVADGALFQP